MRIFGVTGRKDSGKTTLVARLVAEFTARGLRVSTVKHAHHDTDIDQPGRDSHRHREAGAAQVLLAGPRRWALMEELRAAPEPPLAAHLARLDKADLVLIEGYKQADHPMIELWRGGITAAPLAAERPAIRALASDQGDGGTGLPVLHPDDVAGIADFIAAETGLDRLRRGASSMPPGVDWTPVDAVLERLRQTIRPIAGMVELPIWQAAGHVLSLIHI